MDNNKPLKDQREIYDVVTWLNIHVAQLSYTRNLIIVLATALIGFIAYQASSEDSLYVVQECLINSSLILNILSVFFGIVISILSEWNYRVYRKISRELLKADEYSDNLKEDLRGKKSINDTIEAMNRYLFFLQLTTFGTGVLLIGIAILK